MSQIPEIELSDPAVLADPFTAYGTAREAGPVARLVTPGFGTMWAVTRYDEAKALLTDPRFQLNERTYQRLDVPEHCMKYLRTMQSMDGSEHTRLRRLVSPSFTAGRAGEFRPRIERIVDTLLDDVAVQAKAGPVDLLATFTRPLPIDVICELVGIPDADRTAWRGYGAAVAAGNGAAFTEAVPAIIRDAIATVDRRRNGPGADLLSELIGISAEDQDRLSEDELVTLVWHLVLAGQVPTHLIANSVEILLNQPDQLAALRADDALMPQAVEELTRWCGPQLLTLPRYASEDLTFGCVSIHKGDAVTVALAAVNRDPRVFADPDRLDLRRSASQPAHLGYAHGPHFCLGAALARVQTQVALSGLLHRLPNLALAEGGAHRVLDPGAWRLDRLTVTAND
ncbi:MAG TPA: cytochrome P450 [Pseudonocardiaceae bacterium]|nr:cytochrome P450 [Pseudonocardiaceae bacterium]